MDPVFAWIEGSALSTWIRETPSIWVFPAFVTLHTLGMGFVVGAGAAIDLRILGVARRIPLAPLLKFLPVLWLGLAVNVATGLLLLIAYPTKALTNPVFYIKLACVAAALVLVQKIKTDVLAAPGDPQKPLPASARILAGASLAAWVATITAGRLLAYTHRWEMLGIPAIM